MNRRCMLYEFDLKGQLRPEWKQYLFFSVALWLKLSFPQLFPIPALDASSRNALSLCCVNTTQHTLPNTSESFSQNKWVVHSAFDKFLFLFISAFAFERHLRSRSLCVGSVWAVYCIFLAESMLLVWPDKKKDKDCCLNRTINCILVYSYSKSQLPHSLGSTDFESCIINLPDQMKFQAEVVATHLATQPNLIIRNLNELKKCN